ncbi:MAG: methyltransferase protein [Bacteroidetes bacterium]|nr:methyltransferase protein [Bacteroidota bacterium]MDF2452453.1 methyltransferase protein [Bacteroidota bacterium]
MYEGNIFNFNLKDRPFFYNALVEFLNLISKPYFWKVKVFQYTYYFFRSLYYRGIVNTFKLLTYEKKYEKQLGINTHSIVNLEELTLAGDESDQNHHYQGASYFVLFSVFQKLPTETKAFPLIDYGCGKGRALFVAEQCGFTDLVGVDIAKELIDHANENKAIYRPKNANSKLSFLFEDATKYKIPGNACVFYFFNPFGENILRQVIQNIKESVKQHPREIYCIYLNPKYKAVFDQNGFKVYHIEKNNRYLEGIIYTF